MTTFLILIAVLQVLVLVPLLRPLWARQPTLTMVLLAILPLATMLLYRVVGNAQAIALAPQSAALATASGDPGQAGDMPHRMDEAIAQLEQAMQEHPDKADGWMLLGRSYLQVEQAQKASEAFGKALALEPDNPDLLVQAAQTRALANATRLFDATARGWLDKAVLLQPRHQEARWFIGVSQRQNGQHAEAAKTWEALLPEVPAETAPSLLVQINEARAAAGLAALPSSTVSGSAAPVGTTPAASGSGLAVSVRLDPDFAARTRLDGNAVVFVLARAPSGPPMPVAAERHTVQQLPLSITLDDGDSPMPTMKLSQLPEVEIIARISASGIANRQDGDIESAPVLVKLPHTGTVELVLGAPAAAAAK